MNRRNVLGVLGLGGVACATRAATPVRQPDPISHYLTLSFDDGFARSMRQVADIYEAHRLRACINVIATGHHPDFFVAGDSYIKPGTLGDFTLWNALQARGHEIMPHGYRHARKTELPLADAQALIEKCLITFERELAGFTRARAIFNFPFNASSPELEAWLPSQVRAFRTGIKNNRNPWNRFPVGDNRKLVCVSRGPEPIDAFVEGKVNEFLAGPPGWFIFNAHGLDGEGWGPLSSACLDRLLARLGKLPHVGVLPVGAVLDRGEALQGAGARRAG